MSSSRWVNHFRLSVVNNHIVDYPSAVNGSYFYSFGSRAGRRLVVQLVTGIFLARHYTPHVDLAFDSVEHIRRDVNYGWLRRYLHANGASFFFIIVYLHILRGLYYGSYIRPREHLWRSGIVIFILRRGTGFIGYVLPFGQRSLWGATVITNLASAVPFVGDSIVQWVWGGFSVDNATLNRFFSLHYLLPFLIVGVVIAHLALLHEGGVGSTNPLGTDSTPYRIPFYPYFYVKDLRAFTGLRFVFNAFVFFAPNLLGHPDNYIPANPRVTPAHIVPEWYFLSFYAILRSIPHKLLGVIARLLALVSPRLLPFISTSEVRSTRFRPIYRVCYWIFVVDCVILGWIGQKVVEYPYVEVGQVATFIYFFFIFVAVPVSGRLESYLRRRDVKLIGETVFYKNRIAMQNNISKVAKGAASTGGRNFAGRITCYHRGGGHKRLKRNVVFNYSNGSKQVKEFYYDPRRGALLTQTGVGSLKVASVDSDANLENSNREGYKLSSLAPHTKVHSIEMVKNKGAQLVRSAGSFATIVNQVLGYTRVRLPSGEERLIPGDCRCEIGVVSGVGRSVWSRKLHERAYGKAGRSRWLGIRPTVRGTARNPVDHPHGGGQGKTSGGRPSVTPWSVAKGVRTTAGRGATYVVVSRRKAAGKIG